MAGIRGRGAATILFALTLLPVAGLHAAEGDAADLRLEKRLDYLTPADARRGQLGLRLAHERLRPAEIDAHRRDLLFGEPATERDLLGPGPGIDFYGATITWPFRSRHLELDLGLNLRLLRGELTAGSGDAARSLRLDATVPSLYATALFDLPLEGLEAGFEGSYGDTEEAQLADYRARISFTLDNGFGVSGGWFQRQMRFGQADGRLDFEDAGPFLDLHFRF